VILHDPRNQERIFSYLGGEEVNTSPTYSPHRYVINFEDFSLEKANQWPDLLEIIRTRVKPERDTLRGNPDADRRRNSWWLWGRYTPALFRSLKLVGHVFVMSRVTAHLGLARVPASLVCSVETNTFTLDTWPPFAVLQSRPHEIWARFFASSLEDRLRYTPSDCFGTFPFPPNYEDNPALEQAGRAYYDFRATLMVRNNEGLTKTYNRFHNPNDVSPEITQLRRLHDAMDRAVLDTYGWINLNFGCEFLSEFDDDEREESESGGTRPPKYRYRWSDETHDDVLARLLELNRIRAEEQAQSVATTAAGRVEATRGRKLKSTLPAEQGTLYEDSTE
jgi:hypothetical protein